MNKPFIFDLSCMLSDQFYSHSLQDTITIDNDGNVLGSKTYKSMIYGKYMKQLSYFAYLGHFEIGDEMIKKIDTFTDTIYDILAHDQSFSAKAIEESVHTLYQTIYGQKLWELFCTGEERPRTVTMIASISSE